MWPDSNPGKYCCDPTSVLVLAVSPYGLPVSIEWYESASRKVSRRETENITEVPHIADNRRLIRK